MLRGLLLLCASMAIFTTNAQAQVAGAPVVVDSARVGPVARPPTMQERLLLRDQWVRQREYDRSQIRIGGPLTGVLLGAAVLGTSAWLLTRGQNGQVGGVALGLFVGLPLTGLSAMVLGKRVKKRRAIWREVWEPAR